MEKIKNLVEKINTYAHHYYVLDNPIISDKEYDALYDELVKLEAETGIVLKNSPTQRVGDKILKGFKKYTHKSRLYSLDKRVSQQELISWFEKANKVSLDFFGVPAAFTLEYKFDGLTVNLFYDEGLLKTAATRGTGLVGEDVTAQIKTIKSIPLEIPFKGQCEIQGEVIMKTSALNEFNQKNPLSPLKNERNGAAGAVRNLDPKVTAKRKLEVMVFSVGYISDKECFDTQEGMIDFLRKNGFKVSEYFTKSQNVEYFLQRIDELQKQRSKLDFLIDGVVFKADSLSLREILGHTEKFPRFSVAFKFEAEEATTQILDVKWQVSRTGKLNPLAILEPVELGGATIQRATLNNIAEIKRKDIKINSRVFVRRSNDVIPEIMGVAEHLPNSITIEPPDSCPACGAPIKHDAVFIYCQNVKNCRAAVISKFEHYCSKDALNIEGLSQKTLEVFYDKLKCRILADLYKLKIEEIAALDGFKEKRAENIVTSIARTLNPELADFVYALGIEGVGKKSAKALAQSFESFEMIMNANQEQIFEIKDFGEVTAKNVYDFFADLDNLHQIQELYNVGLQAKDYVQAAPVQGIFSGKTIAFTGTLQRLKRGDAKRVVESLGAKTADSITREVNLVVAGIDAKSKLEKANKLGIEVIDEEKLLYFINLK